MTLYRKGVGSCGSDKCVYYLGITNDQLPKKIEINSYLGKQLKYFLHILYNTMPSTVAQLRASAKYRRVHKEELREKMAVYMETYSKDHYDKNRDKILAYKKMYNSPFEAEFRRLRNILI